MSPGIVPGDIRWAGTRALLIELESLDAVLAVHRHLVEDPLAGQVEVLAAARTVLAVFDSRTNARAARATFAGLDFSPRKDALTRQDPVRIEVVYDGEDLTEVGRLTGLGKDGVIQAHTGQLWTAAFGGFAPGFAYLVGENELLNIPRRSSPRTAVPAGSVALAGNFSAVYPRRSPGGWQLIGRTSERMWDLNRDQPALLRPGHTVQYVAVRELIEVSDSPRAHDDGASRRPVGSPALEVLAPGPQALIQDLGRPGFSDLGVSSSGAADTASAHQANRLVGNEGADAVVECVLGGLAVQAHGELTVALAGAPVPAVIDGPHGERHASMYAPFALYDGESLELAAPDTGLRTYLAVRGGINVPAVLGSRATDLMSGIGPAPLTQGTLLPAGEVRTGHIVGAPEPPELPFEMLRGNADQPVELRITAGPRQDWFTPESRAALTLQIWTVTAESNRIGLRLGTHSGAALQRAITDELPSEGVVAGSLQVPPSGLPVLFLADHPVTGGYPVIGVVVPEDLPLAAQLPPGATVRFIESGGVPGREEGPAWHSTVRKRTFRAPRVTPTAS